NDAPVAQARNLSTTEDTAVEFHLQATDIENDPVTFLEPTEPSFGVLEQLGPGHYRYHPQPDFHGVDTFVYVANDGAADSLPATVTIQVTPVNDAPQAHPQGLTTREDTPLSIVLSGSDIDGDSLVILEPTAPQHGVLTRDPGNPARFTYQPHADFHGSDSFTFAVKDGEFTSAPALVAIEVEPVNDAPAVNIGDDRSLAQTGSLTLQAVITDDGTPEGEPRTQQWEKVSGPAPVLFSEVHSAETFAYFAEPGTYVIRFVLDDAGMVASDELTVTVLARNLAPSVSAGADQIVSLPNPISLAGTANDDGRPAGKTLSAKWQLVAGPGVVTFTDQNALATTATFTEPGSYLLRLSASDSELSASDELAVTVQPKNTAPVVSAGGDQSIRSGEQVTLTGTTTDDGLPLAATLSVQWSQISGPGVATFADATAPVTTVTFSTPGTYVLRLESSDSELSGLDEVSINVAPPANRAPIVHAGADQKLDGLTNVRLLGTVEDDGRPDGRLLTVTWMQVSGPGTASFTEAFSPVTTATFSVAGTY
ncbi:MAG: tandem-95 repeat protein, partial [Verrucomicrobiaceae bacterium]